MANLSRRTLKLRQIGKIVTGTTPPSANPEQFGSEHPFITPSDIVAGERAVTTDRFLSPQGADTHQRRLIPAEAVCFTCIGATIGKICMTSRTSLTNQQINSVVVDPDVAVAHYVYYLLRFETDRIKALASGSATPIINKGAFSEIEVELPPFQDQLRISDILSAYDDLIENNTRRIAILEEMAQTIYREWFVHFRFPGHEEVELVESELGPIPKGWEATSLGAVSSRVLNSVNPLKHPSELFAHYSFPAFDTGQRPILEHGADIRSTKHVVDAETVLIARLNPRIPRVWLPKPDETYRSVCSTEFVVLDPESLSVEFLYSLLRSQEFLDRMIARASGTSTSHQRVRVDDLLDMLVIRPPIELIDAFSRVAEPILSLVETLRRKEQYLRQTRDLLLPKLITGEIDVEALESEPMLAGA